MKRKLIIAANWKMNKGPAETTEFIESFLPGSEELSESCDIIIAPPYVSLPVAASLLADSVVALSAQNVSDQDEGAFTGEVATCMLNEVGAQYVILGHSERRAIYGESDQFINAKVRKALAADLHPIFCIGETLEEREGGKLEEVLRAQVSGGLDDLTVEDMAEVVVAYEPVWAIGTGKVATPLQAPLQAGGQPPVGLDHRGSWRPGPRARLAHAESSMKARRRSRWALLFVPFGGIFLLWLTPPVTSPSLVPAKRK